MKYELPLASLFYQDPDDASDPVVPYYTAEQTQAAYQAGREPLIAAIQQCLSDNAHLADGDDCTLKGLKDALRTIGIDPEEE